MALKTSYFTTLLVILIISTCSAQKISPTTEFINSQYYNLIPLGKSKLSVNVTVKEMQDALKQVVEPLKARGDSLLAGQFNSLHVILSYDRTIDSVTINLSPLDISESSPLFEGSQKIKSGYYDMVAGAFKQFRPMLIDSIFSNVRSENEITSYADNITVDVTKSDSRTRYILSTDFKDVTMSGSIDNQDFSGLMKAIPLGEKLAFDYLELATPLIKIMIRVSYFQEGNTILPSEMKIKNEIKPTTVDITMVFSDWKFE